MQASKTERLQIASVLHLKFGIVNPRTQCDRVKLFGGAHPSSHWLWQKETVQKYGATPFLTAKILGRAIKPRDRRKARWHRGNRAMQDLAGQGKREPGALQEGQPGDSDKGEDRQDLSPSKMVLLCEIPACPGAWELRGSAELPQPGCAQNIPQQLCAENSLAWPRMANKEPAGLCWHWLYTNSDPTAWLSALPPQNCGARACLDAKPQAEQE